METRVQCGLVRGNQRDVQWIPTEYAEVGKRIRVQVDGEWEYGWVISSVADLHLPEAYVAERSRDWRTQRRGSDI